MSIKRIKISDYKRINESEEASSDKEFQEHLDDAMNRINNEGELPEDVFDVDGDWGSGCLRIKLDDKYNMLTWDRATKQYSLLFNDWYDGMGLFFTHGWLPIQKNNNNKKIENFINKEGELFSSDWYQEVGKFINGRAIVKIDDDEYDLIDDLGGSCLSAIGTNWNIYENLGNNIVIFSGTIRYSRHRLVLCVDNTLIDAPYSSDVYSFDNYDIISDSKDNQYIVIKIQGSDTSSIYKMKDKEFLYCYYMRDVEQLPMFSDNIKHTNLSHGGFMLTNLINGNKNDIPYTYKDIKESDYYIHGINEDNTIYIINPNTGQPLHYMSFKEILVEDFDRIIGKDKDNKYRIILENGKQLGYDYDKIEIDNVDSDTVYVYMKNEDDKRKGTWNIVDILSGNKKSKNSNDRIISDFKLKNGSRTKPIFCEHDNSYLVTNYYGRKERVYRNEKGIYESLTENLNENIIDEEVSPEDVDLSSFAIKDELCPDFWEDGRFDQSARRTLLAIAKSFIEHLEIEDEVEDITVTGSIANYNWDENSSDIDLHILMDFSKLSDDPEILKKFFDAERKIWNKDHYEISIYGYPVEVYVQDINEEHHSSGIYSLLKDEWIKEPSKDNLSDENTDYDHVQEITSSIMTVIDELDLDKDDPQTIYNDADTLFNNIKDIRKSGMGSDSPEMSDGNIIFKSLRRSGYMEKLIDIRTKAFDMIHSI